LFSYIEKVFVVFRCELDHPTQTNQFMIPKAYRQTRSNPDDTKTNHLMLSMASHRCRVPSANHVQVEFMVPPVLDRTLVRTQDGTRIENGEPVARHPASIALLCFCQAEDCRTGCRQQIPNCVLRSFASLHTGEGRVLGRVLRKLNVDVVCLWVIGVTYGVGK
jgi:hypothetical protein